MRREAPYEVDIKHSLHRLTVDYGLFSNSRFYKIFNDILYVLKEEKLKPSILKKWRLLGIVLVAFIVGVVGCDEAQNMMQPVVSEPADTTPPTMVGEVKEEPEETPATEPEEEPAEEPEQEETPTPEPEEPTDPTPPADTTPPTVVEVGWYSDEQMTQALTMDSTVHPEDTVYTVVTFSEPVVHVVADDNTARPALFIVADGMATRYEVVPHGADLKTGEAQPIHGDTDEYLCKYTIPAGTVGTVALQVGSGTADTAGNRVAEVSEHIAPFVVTTPEPEPASLTLPPGYTLPPELIPTEPTVLSADEQALIEADEVIGWDSTATNLQTQAGKDADLISLLPHQDREEVYSLFVASVDLPFFAEAAEKMKEGEVMLRTLWAEYKKTGNWSAYDTFRARSNFELNIPSNNWILADIYFEENPQDPQYRDGHSYYWMYLEWYRLQLEHYGKVEPEYLPVLLPELLDHFRESARNGYIQGLDNPFD